MPYDRDTYSACIFVPFSAQMHTKVSPYTRTANVYTTFISAIWSYPDRESTRGAGVWCQSFRTVLAVRDRKLFLIHHTHTIGFVLMCMCEWVISIQSIHSLFSALMPSDKLRGREIGNIHYGSVLKVCNSGLFSHVETDADSIRHFGLTCCM